MLDRRRLICQTGRLLVGTAGAALMCGPRGPLMNSGFAQPLQGTPAGAAALSIDGAGSLRVHASAQGLRYGAAVDVGLLRTDAAYRRLLAEQCGIVVAENAMKWAAVHPAPDRYTFDQADALVAFAEQHGMEVRGHNLCWHEALPSWFATTVTPANAAQVLVSHIQTVAGRYKGRLRAWDVVNEAVEPKDRRSDGLRDSPWLRLLGPGYLKLAFHTARQADPHALLTYNDYGIEYDDPDSVIKRSAVLALLRRFKAEATPLDAVGIQSHLSAASPHPLGPGIAKFVTDVRTLGLDVFVTEMDINDDDVEDDDPAVRDFAVAKVYRDYVSAMVAAGVTDILTWGVSDNHSWLNNSKTHKEKHPDRQERALPFDAAYLPKPAFYALRDGLDSRKA